MVAWGALRLLLGLVCLYARMGWGLGIRGAIV